MSKVSNIDLDEVLSLADKIALSSKHFEDDAYKTIKCYKAKDDIQQLECKKINLTKLHKSVFINLRNLHTLDLRENKLLKLSKHFATLKHLKVLRVDFNQISYIPAFIKNLEKLETLSINNNNLTYIPSSIQYLHNLKILRFANNQVNTIPIEFGLLKSLECLHMDANHFTEIPTTFCYLKHLSELSFDWLEFLDPPFQKTIKDNIGKTIIGIIRTSLQELIKQSILYCNLNTFIEKNSNTSSRRETTKGMGTIEHETEQNNKNMDHKLEKKADNNNYHEVFSNRVGSPKLGDRMNNLQESQVNQQKKLAKIFYAIENNYYGVIKVRTCIYNIVTYRNK